ncbi:TetR/AcrR family transcriptional regulator [Lactiplantibacillus garii]|uniref:TetR/AcrR family transcriptional regulator n=1 Tax=Lactiplantibacillus garii TaxID=2306423 RepID=A0A426D6I4_9LACO|nr:TetR/AcrR family transcriptional regulator [Lactiplantibacillus garii]RRK10212.1 TetR/AcrR family transcriptional regulator [Lactiplantibacillus garii]
MKKKDMSKQAKIQDAVAAIILKEGPAGVSTTKVARRVGIAQSNVYLYFKNKQALIDSVYQRETQRIINTTALAALADETVALPERIRMYVQQVYDYSLAHPDSLTLLQQIKSLKGQGMELTVGADDPNNVVVRLLTAGVTAGVLKPLPVNLFMSLVFAVIHTHTTNVKNGLTSSTAVNFDTLYPLIWDAIRLG